MRMIVYHLSILALLAGSGCEESGTGIHPSLPAHTAQQPAVPLIDSKNTEEEIVGQLLDMEQKSLAILAKYDLFQPVTEADKAQLIQALEKFYTSEQAQIQFDYQYKKNEAGYIRVPIDYISIRHVKRDIHIEQNIGPDWTILTITGEDEHQNPYAFEYIFDKELTHIQGIQATLSPN
ncbi:hypothetical protein [Paenibacillus puerhi]|uniref:hypothetical protein n=1 Tax=Paenibacillus puerhi TaxID=2692622 RepID=UPI0013590D52|nr:hypothetical protein [Paenibacillus puerhi]